MSISVLLLSLLFAVIEAGLSYLVFAFTPVASVLSSVPTFLLVGGVFAVGMLLAFLLIIIIGFVNVSCRAADFVRDYFGKTLVLAVISSLILGGLATGAELLYQIRPNEGIQDREGYIKVPVETGIMDTLLTPRRNFKYEEDLSTLAQNVQIAGGNVSGPLRFSIQWNEPELNLSDNNDMDAHCESDDDMHIYYPEHKRIDSITAGSLDVDVIYPVTEMYGRAAVENIVFPEIERIKGRTFRFYVVCFDYRSGASGFRAEIKMGDQVFSYDYRDALVSKGSYPVADVTVDIAGNMTIVHHMPPVKTTSLETPVETVALEEKGALSVILDNSAVIRCIMLGILVFAFKLITGICIGKNNRSFIMHLIFALIIAVIACLVVEFGYKYGLPVWAVIGAFWILLNVHIVSAD